MSYQGAKFFGASTTIILFCMNFLFYRDAN